MISSCTGESLPTLSVTDTEISYFRQVVELFGCGTTDYKRLRVKTQNFVFLSNVTRTLIFHKLLTNSDCTMNLRLFHFHFILCRKIKNIAIIITIVICSSSETL